MVDTKEEIKNKLSECNKILEPMIAEYQKVGALHPGNLAPLLQVVVAHQQMLYEFWWRL